MEYVCHRQFLTFSWLVGLAMVGGGGGSSASASSGSQPTSLSAAVDPVVKAAMQQQGIPGISVALATNGSMLILRFLPIYSLFRNSPLCGRTESDLQSELCGPFLNATNFLFPILLFVIVHPFVDVFFSVLEHAVDESGKHVG